MASIVDKVSGQPTLDVARRAVEQAEAAVAAEAKRIALAEEEIQRVSDDIAATDPDSDAAFVKLVRQRDAARGRIEALQVRAERAVRSLDSAREALKQAELEAMRQEMAALDDRATKLDDALTARVRALATAIPEEATAIRALVAEADAIARKLHAAEGEPPRGRRLRSRWAPAGFFRGALWTAAEVMGQQP